MIRSTIGFRVTTSYRCSMRLPVAVGSMVIVQIVLSG